MFFKFSNYENNPLIYLLFMLVVWLSGTLHVGDEIREINGNSVVGQTVETLQRTLVSIDSRLSHTAINQSKTFKVV